MGLLGDVSGANTGCVQYAIEVSYSARTHRRIRALF